MKNSISFWHDILVSLFHATFHTKTRSKQMTTYTIHGETYHVRKYTMDTAVIAESVICNIYGKHLPSLKNDDWVIDIGAHIGTDSIHIAKQYPGIRVLCFEPLPENYTLLKKNIIANGISENITALQMGIASTKGKKKLYIDESNSGGSSLSFEQLEKSIEIQSTTLEHIVKQHNIKRIPFLKMDCEGCEYDILYNCPKKILNMIDILALEYHPNGSIQNLKKHLEKNGFVVTLTPGINIPILHRFTNIPLCIATKKI
ncbi:FkbM family methyltransferase [Patescibacteria group bacterium]